MSLSILISKDFYDRFLIKDAAREILFFFSVCPRILFETRNYPHRPLPLAHRTYIIYGLVCANWLVREFWLVGGSASLIDGRRRRVILKY